MVNPATSIFYLIKHVDPKAGWVVLRDHDAASELDALATPRPHSLPEIVQDLAVVLSQNEEPPL